MLDVSYWDSYPSNGSLPRSLYFCNMSWSTEGTGMVGISKTLVREKIGMFDVVSTTKVLMSTKKFMVIGTYLAEI